MTKPLDLGLNRRAMRLVEAMIEDGAVLGVEVSAGPLGERLIDAGARAPGSLAAGLAVARISMGGLAEVTLDPASPLRRWPWRVAVRSSRPVAACLASQYAGWNLSALAGGTAFEGLGSGPARAVAAQEAIFGELDYAEEAEGAVLVVESEEPPPEPVVEAVARACRIEPRALTVIVAPTRSRAGSVQVASRVVEVALSKAHQAKFPLGRIVDALGAAPLPPPHPDHAFAMGRTNDALIYGGQVHLFVTGPAPDARRFAEHLPSSMSRDYGEPFRHIFERVGGDFYHIDPHLFSPAEVLVTAIEHGETYRAGALDPERLDASFD